MKNITIESGLKALTNPGRASLASSLHSENKTISFGKTLTETLKKVNNLQLEADKITEDFATGKTQSIHEVMLSLSKADIAFRLTMQVRNKIVEAYQEIMRMPV